MDLSTAQQILVIALASALAVFLVLAIVIAVLVIRLLKSVRKVAEKAEKVVETAESAATILKNAAGPIGVARLAQKLFTTILKHKKNN